MRAQIRTNALLSYIQEALQLANHQGQISIMNHGSFSNSPLRAFRLQPSDLAVFTPHVQSELRSSEGRSDGATCSHARVYHDKNGQPASLLPRCSASSWAMASCPLISFARFGQSGNNLHGQRVSAPRVLGDVAIHGGSRNPVLLFQHLCQLCILLRPTCLSCTVS